MRMRHWLRGKVRLFIVGVIDVDDSRIVVCGGLFAAAAAFPDEHSDDDACTAGCANPNQDKQEANTIVC